MTDLLPCPFCGGEAKRHDIEAREDVDNAGASYIECAGCGACTQLHFGRKENLLDSWNRRKPSIQHVFLEAVRIAAEVANGVEPSLLEGMSERYVSIYCASRRDASDAIKSIPTAPCDYCGDGKLPGLPGNSCENCMDTGLQYPEFLQ